MDFSDTNLSTILNRLEIDCVTGNFQDRELKIDLEFCRRTADDFENIKDLEILRKHIINHEYDKILETDFFCIKSLKDRSKDFTFVFYEKYGEIKSNYQYLFHSPGEDCSYVKQLILLFIAVSALQEFVKANVCGPIEHTEYAICENLLPNSRYSDECILEALGQDGEVILMKIVHPKLLFLSLLLLFGNSFDRCLTHRWWLFRCVMIHQRILSDRMADLHNLITSLIAKQLEAKFLKNKEEPLAEMMFYTECAYAHLHYSEFNVAEKYIFSAQNVLGFGVRFKRAPISQMRFIGPYEEVIIEIKRNDSRYQSSLIMNQCTLPYNFYNINEDFLNRISLSDSNGKKIKELKPEEQIVLLAYCDLIRKRGGKWFNEETLVIINYLLSQPKVWSIQFKSLIHRTQNTVYTLNQNVEYLNQLKELLTCSKENTPQFPVRQSLLYCVSLPMKYNLKKFFADKLFKVGDLNNALPLYIKLNLWNEAAKCYECMNVDKGIKALNIQIANRPSSILWCCLGDLTNNPDVYKVAWKLSRYSNARSQRRLGYHYYNEKHYKESIYHFKKSLIANYLQPDVLYTMGLAARSCDDNDVAIDAFTAVVRIDQNNFQAWNYLVRAYIQEKDKVKACDCLLECMRHSDDHEYWKSYLLVSAHINSFWDVINGYHKYLDNGKDLGIHKLHTVHLDILGLLVEAVCKDVPDILNIPSSYLKAASLSLFERITSVSSAASSAQIWELYTNLHCAGNAETVTDEAIICQRKALNLYICFAGRAESDSAFAALLRAALKCLHMTYIHMKCVHDITKKTLQLSFTNHLVHRAIVKTDKFRSSGRLSVESTDLLSSVKFAFETLCHS